MTPTSRARSPAASADRRAFLLQACGMAAGATGALAVGGCGGGGSGATAPAAVVPAAPATPAAAAAAPTTPEQDVLNFALNLHYLGAQFYAVAASGAGVSATLLTGTGAAGVAAGGRAVAFADPVIGQFAAEIAAEKLSHLAALRSALGAAAIAQPRIDLSAGVGGAFSAAARAGGVAAAGAAFDPYADDDSFLLAASMFEDVAAAAHRATLPLLAASPGLEAQTAAMADGAYHAGVIRAALQARTDERPEIQTATSALAAARAKLDGAPGGTDVVIDADAVTDVPDGEGPTLPFSRAAQRALRVFYASPGAASAGGFFPDGMNGAIRASA